MDHHTQLIAGFALMLGYAFVGGFLATKLRLPIITGFLAGGVMIGPFTPGPIGDAEIASQLAEVGVILLMFGVGIHFSVRDLLAVKRVAVPGAIVQSVVATALTIGVAMAWGWSFGAGLVLGLAVSVASTVVLIRALSERGQLETDAGRVAIGWLIVEDLLSILVLVVLPPLATSLGGHEVAGAGGAEQSFVMSLLIALAKVTALTVLVLFVFRRALSWVLVQVDATGSEELFSLVVLVVALGVAFGASEIFDVSFALGAFFAGVVVGGSKVSHRAATDVLPFRDIFGILFFVSVGMLLDPRTYLDHPGEILALLAVIIVAKPVAAAGIVLALRRPLSTAMVVGPALAQIGEFSFILAVLGRELGIIPASAQQLIIASAVLTIPLNGVVMATGERLARRLGERFGHPPIHAGSAPSATVMVLPAQVVPAEVPGEFVA